jgi:hypothetical protein
MTAVPRTSDDCQCLHALREANVGHSSQTVNEQVTNGRQQRKGGCDKLCTTAPSPLIDRPTSIAFRWHKREPCVASSSVQQMPM